MNRDVALCDTVQRCAAALDSHNCTCTTRHEHQCQASELSGCAALSALRLAVVHAKLANGCVKLVVYRRGLDIVSDTIARTGRWEISQPWPKAPQASATSSVPQRMLLDLGGNIGYHTMLFALHGYSVIAVEPMPANRRALAGSTCLHPHVRERITVVPAALISPLSADQRVCVLVSRGGNTGDGVLRCGAGPAPPIDCASPTSCQRRFLGYAAAERRGGAIGTCEKVETRSLDEVLAQLRPPSIDVVKIDLEGSECRALEGGGSLFTRYHPLLIDVETQEPHVRKCVEQLAERRSYVLHRPRGPNQNRFLTPR